MRDTEQSLIMQFKVTPLLHSLLYSFDILNIKKQMRITELKERLNGCINVSLHFASICLKSRRPQ